MNTKVTWQTVDVTVVKTTDVEGVGSVRTIGEKLYRWVKNADAAVDLAVGDAAYHKITDLTTVAQNVYQCLTANLSLLAGFAAGAITHGTYGWVQIYGPGSVSASGATTGGTVVAAGDWLKGVNTANYMVRDGASTAQATFNRCVQTLVAIPTTTTPAAALVAGFIRCLD